MNEYLGTVRHATKHHVPLAPFACSLFVTLWSLPMVLQHNNNGSRPRRHFRTSARYSRLRINSDSSQDQIMTREDCRPTHTHIRIRSDTSTVCTCDWRQPISRCTLSRNKVDVDATWCGKPSPQAVLPDSLYPSAHSSQSYIGLHHEGR